MKKVISVVGARPNFMKVAPIHRALQACADRIQHVIVHTGQHYDVNMSDVFFQEHQLPEPDVFLGVGSGSHAEVTARVMMAFEGVVQEHKPDLVIVVGDVNSSLACGLTARKLHVPLVHIESGLRSGDREMPEELNRLAIDAVCDYAFVTEQSGLDNLLREGWPRERIFFRGNTMIDSLFFILDAARACPLRAELGLTAGEYVLVTLHRPSNVDDKEQLRGLLQLLRDTADERDVVLPLHPRTRARIEKFGMQAMIEDHPRLHILEPQSPVRFTALMREAALVLTDSGGIQEETTALKVPCVTMRTSTERPSTITLGSNRLVAPQVDLLRTALAETFAHPPQGTEVPPFWDGRAAERIANDLDLILRD